MTSADTVGRCDRLRLFCALRLPEPIVERLTRWSAGLSGGRRVGPEQLHVTLAFLGSCDPETAGEIAAALQGVAEHAGPIVFRPGGYRETKSVGMLVLADEGGHAAALARDLQGRLESLGAPGAEARPWLPHVTVLRFRARPRLTPEPPALGAFSPSDAALYHSVLRSTGAQYRIIDTAALGG